MIKQFITLTLAVSVLAVFSGAAVATDFPNVQLNTPGTQRTLMLPVAADYAPVISLGSSVDPSTGEAVQGYAIVHYKTDYTHRTGHAKGGTTTTSCYGFFAKDAKWRLVEPWVMNTDNSHGLASDFVFTNLATNIAKWEDATDGLVGNGVAGDILGDGSVTVEVLVADMSSPDNVNEVYFADVSSSGAIAVTIVWGIFGGPTYNRKLVEWDMIFDEVDYDWSPSGEAGKMDFENIATHELGHAAGLADLYSLGCANETMYGYADYGETKKQSLNSGDIAGMNRLY